MPNDYTLHQAVRGLADEAQANAERLISFLEAADAEFEKGRGYWADQLYWYVRYRSEYVCFILINGPGSSGPGWTVWSDDSGSNWYERYSLGQNLRGIAWEHVDHCTNCGNGCNPGSHKTIFDRGFDNVCRTTFRFDDPDGEAVGCLKQLIAIRLKDIANGSEPA